MNGSASAFSHNLISLHNSPDANPSACLFAVGLFSSMTSPVNFHVELYMKSPS